MTTQNLTSLAGIAFFLFIAWLFSTNRKAFPWRLVFFGLSLQLVFAAMIFLMPFGQTLFFWVNDLFVKVLSASGAGSRFIFGPLASSPGTEGSVGFILVFQAFPTIIFFSALMAVLYYYKILPKLISLLAKLFSKLLKVTGVESLVAASNIFVGVESLTAIQPYLKKLSASQLLTVMTCGLATIASSMLGFYVFVLKESIPGIAGHLISASFISAPAALIMAKVMWPSSDDDVTDKIEVTNREHSGFISAFIGGAESGGKLVFAVSFLLIASLGLVELIDMFLGWLTSLAGPEFSLKLQDLLAYVFYPFALGLGVPLDDVGHVSRLLGMRLVVTEVAAYQELVQLSAQGAFSSARTAIVTSYALCGFTHVASLAIFSGGITALAPEQKNNLPRVLWRAMMAATLACLMTGAVVGVFLPS